MELVEGLNGSIIGHEVNESHPELLFSGVNLTLLNNPLHELGGVDGRSGSNDGGESERSHIRFKFIII